MGAPRRNFSGREAVVKDAPSIFRKSKNCNPVAGVALVPLHVEHHNNTYVSPKYKFRIMVALGRGEADREAPRGPQPDLLQFVKDLK